MRAQARQCPTSSEQLDFFMRLNECVRGLIAVIYAGALAGCASNPPASAIKTAATFANSDADTYAAEPVVQAFWRTFDDLTLNDLIARALHANRDLRAAEARLRQSRALSNQSKTDFLPSGGASLQYAEVRAFGGPVARNYLGNAQAQWEADVFGRIRYGVSARSADARAAVADVHAALVTVTSETARVYFQLRGVITRLGVARVSAENQTQSMELTQARYEEGAGSELDLQRARAQLRSTLATIPTLEAQRQQLLNQLAVLLGETPGQLSLPEVANVDAISMPELAAVGDPQEWMRRRPDIRRAEARLASAAAAAKVSIASLFPKVTLNALATSSAPDAGGALDKAHSTLIWGPTLSWAVLSIPRLLYDVSTQRARRDESLAVYEQTVLNALAETESALAAYRFSRQRMAELEAANEAGARSEELARVRYEAGAADFLSVLDAQRTQLQIADQLAQSRADRATALIAVYKSLGIGWDLQDAQAALTH